jgi:uncharacterized membrane protein
MKSLRSFTLSIALVICVPLLQAQLKDTVSQVDLTLTPIDVPGAVFTIAWGINSAGDIVGNYGQSTSNDSHGFLYSNGVFTFFDHPAVPNFTVPRGINDVGQIVGNAGQSPVYGFIYDGTKFTAVKLGSQTTFADGINNAGLVVGGVGTIYTTQGFEKIGQRFKRLYPDGSFIYVYGTGINNFRKVVGYADNGGWLYSNGTFQTIMVPGSSKTEPLGINDSGVVVGWYDLAPNSYAFVLKNGKYMSFGYPGAKFTGAGGINSAGQIVGAYTFDNIVWHAFVTNP